MRYLSLGAALAVLMCAAPAMAEGPFDGTWKIDAASAQLPTKPYVMTLADGGYGCTSCVPPYSVPADGAFHAVTGQPYFDEAAVQIVDPQTVKMSFRKSGKLTDTETETVAADGKTMSFDDIDTSAPTGQPLETKGTMTRVADGAAGSHAAAGSWRADKLPTMSDDAMTATITTDGDNFTFSQPTGYHYTAQFGGAAVPIIGDQAGTMTMVAKKGPRTIVETDMRDGKAVSTLTMTAAADGKTIDFVGEDKLRGTTTRFKARRM